MAEKKKLSVADILAAARKSDASAGSAGGNPVASESGTEVVGSENAPAGSAPAEPAPSSAIEKSGTASAPSKAPSAKPAGAKPGVAKGGAAKPGALASSGRPSVSDVLAKARAQGKASEPSTAPSGETESPAPITGPAPTTPAKKTMDVPPKKAALAAVGTGASAGKDTASILTAARKANQPGPMSKSEAAARPGRSERPLHADAPSAPGAKAAKAPKSAPPMPPKPVMVRGKAAAAEPPAEERRFFLGVMLGSFLGIGFTSVGATLGLWTLGTARFMFPNILTEPPSRFKVGFPGDFSPGTVEEKFKALFGVWVVNAQYQGQPQIFALRTVCTHLGCTPNWLEGEQKFKCPCHGSGFYKDGINFEGPAPRPLERYAIQLADDGQLEIDKSKLFQEELGQWTDSASFVPA